MTEQEQKAFDQMREALESVAWHGGGSCWIVDDDKIEAALTAANAVQPQSQADSGRIVECARRLVEHADFALGGILSADSKAKDIPSKAVSQVKSRHLAALRDALSAPPAAEPAQAAFARLDKCEGKPDGTCDKCGGSCMWFGKPAAPEAA